MTQSNAGCWGRRAPRRGRDYRGKTCCFELAESAIETRTGDRSASSAVGLDVLGSVTAVNPCGAARQTETDLERIFRASREDVDVRTDGTSEAHSLPFRARVLVLPLGHPDPSTARSANLTMLRSFPQGSNPRNFKFEKSRVRWTPDVARKPSGNTRTRSFRPEFPKDLSNSRFTAPGAARVGCSA